MGHDDVICCTPAHSSKLQKVPALRPSDREQTRQPQIPPSSLLRHPSSNHHCAECGGAQPQKYTSPNPTRTIPYCDSPRSSIAFSGIPIRCPWWVATRFIRGYTGPALDRRSDGVACVEKSNHSKNAPRHTRSCIQTAMGQRTSLDGATGCGDVEKVVPLFFLLAASPALVVGHHPGVANRL